MTQGFWKTINGHMLFLYIAQWVQIICQSFSFVSILMYHVSEVNQSSIFHIKYIILLHIWSNYNYCHFNWVMCSKYLILAPNSLTIAELAFWDHKFIKNLHAFNWFISYHSLIASLPISKIYLIVTFIIIMCIKIVSSTITSSMGIF